MSGGRHILLAAAAALSLSGCAQTGKLTIRAKPTGLAAGERPLSFRIAEARGQFALGNVALALEGFRRGLREEPGSVDAMNGIAACYDRMARFDLSREYYEMALAAAPTDPRLYANFALSLEMQGRKAEAGALRGELTSRRAAAEAAAAALAAVQAGRPTGSSETAAATQPLSAEQPSVEVTALDTSALPLPAPIAAEFPSSAGARPIAEAAPSVSIALPLAEPRPDSSSGARLERLSMGEVALVTSGPLQWKRRSAERAQAAGYAPEASAGASPPLRLTLLNAARSHGLAARTRALLRHSSLGRIAIGDAAQVRRSSLIFYPSSRRAEAVKIASRLGLPLQHRTGRDNRLVVYLGRDAATALVARRP
jgi:hypothetical protein